MNWPILGQLPSYLRDPLGFLDRSAQQPGVVARLRLPGPTVLIKEPEDLRYILEIAPQHFGKSPRLVDDTGLRLSGRGVLTSQGDRHQRLRQALHPLFSRTALSAFVPTLDDAIHPLLDSIATAPDRIITTDLPWLAKRIIGRVTFGVDYAAGFDQVAADFRTRRDFIQYQFRQPFPFTVPAPVTYRYRRAASRLDAFLSQSIAAARQQPTGTTLVNLMTSALSDDEVRDEALTLGITGYETLGESLVWTLWLLSQHAAWQARLRDEANAVLSSQPTAESLSHLTLTTQVIQESMRLYPPTWIFIRVARHRATLPSGAQLEPCDKLYLSPWVIHRDPRWFPEPAVFDPDRFTSARIAERPKLAYFPFGAGPRLCLGIHLARMEAALVIARLLQRFSVQPISTPATPVPGITLHPKQPVRLRFQPWSA